MIGSESVFARHQWLERDGRAVYLYPRRFGREQPEVLQRLREACDGAVCGTLAGAAITPLLAAQPECSQQDLADAIIDASRQFDAATQANMIAIAQEYRQSEKNTPPDFTTNPPTLRNSVFCQKAPKNAELNGLVQAQDPANDPDVFFDPALRASVARGSQANTAPFAGAGAAAGANNGGAAAGANDGGAAAGANNGGAAAGANDGGAVGAGNCPAQATVTVTACAAAQTAAAETTAPAAGNVGDADFGSCSVPQIEFAAGFDNRRETSFQPVDANSFSQGSAQNVNIITRAICDTLVNTCDANQAAQDLCATAQAAAAAAAVGTGAQADAFNAVFGINTNFAAVQQIDNQGNPVGTPAAGAGNAGAGAANQTQNQNQNNGAAAGNNNAGANTGAAAGGNLQAFGGNLGGVAAPVVTDLGGGRFQVTGNAAFNNLRSALVRSCDVQNNQCANAANGNRNAGFSVGQCNAQQAECIAQAGN